MSAVRIHHTRCGNGPAIVLSHALGCNLHMYDEVAADLARDFTVICYDHRAHGGSESPQGPYDIADFAEDAAALIERESDGLPVIFAGTSLGGMTAQTLAARHPRLIRGLVVANSNMQYDEAARDMWTARIALVREQGLEALVEGAMARWFSPEFHARQPNAIERARQVLLSCDVEAYAASCAAIMAIDFSTSNATIQCPVLVIDGQFDSATPAAMSDAIAQSISQNATRASLATGHLGAAEDPVGFAQLVRNFAQTL